MEDPDFHREFIDHCAVYMGDFLNLEGVKKIWEPMYELIKYEYPFHRKLINQWWPNYSEEKQKAETWLNQRTNIFYSQLASYYKLGTPVTLLITQAVEPAERAAVSFNGIRLSEGVFNGKFFADRALTLEATAPEGKVISGWRIIQVGGGSTTSTREVAGPQLSMMMPACTRLIITPIQGNASGIEPLATTPHERPDAIHTLSGQRLSSPRKGINIVNGRKVIVR
jgi:hypothetical protein